MKYINLLLLYQDDCGDGSDEISCPSECFFEDAGCTQAWQNDPDNGLLLWKQQTGAQSNPVGQGGPSTDHTLQSAQGK